MSNFARWRASVVVGVVVSSSATLVVSLIKTIFRLTHHQSCIEQPADKDQQIRIIAVASY
jgi:hypothetical protein